MMDRYSPVSARIRSILLCLGPLASLAIAPYSNFDPINLIKLLFVVSLSFAILFLAIGTEMRRTYVQNRALLLCCFLFVAWLFLAMLVSDSHWTQQFWGVFGRNTGALTYFSLVVILIATAVNGEFKFYRKLVDALVLTSVPMTLYALVQLAGRDPISWSEMAPFATLGNINFSSAFFGLAALCGLTLAFDFSQALWLRIALICLVVTQMLIVLETGSIQGFMIFIAGLGVTLFLWIRTRPKLKILQIPYVFLGLVCLGMVVVALFNLGPLARFVFQSSVLFRFDYWYAGWMMTLKSPFVGLGLDSYGDWYRELRGEVATLRTGPDRITNTAHNIFLDISASGGFPLLAFYLLILGIALRSAIRVIKRQVHFDPYFSALFSAWIAYLIQAGVSINQIGVGIWGWLFTGALVGYELVTRDQSEKPRSKGPPGIHSKVLSASASLVGIVGFAVGFVLAFVPLKADMDFKEAIQNGTLEDRFSAARGLGSTAFHLELTLDGAIKANDERLTSEVMYELLRRHPRDFMAWRVKQVLATSSPEEREEAYQRLKAMDPHNPEIQRAE